MTDTLLPLPKYIIESGGYTVLPSVISSEPEFVKAGKAFAAYIKEDFGANMVKGTDGIRLCNNVHLPEEGYHLTTSQKGVEIFASTSRGINRGLSTLFQMIKKEDGSLKIMDDTDSDAVVTEAMKAALENEEVKNLIEQVQNDYQNALDADASLRAYVESIQ